MEDDLKRGLLNKKVGFDKIYEQGLIRVAKIRQKNDAFQKHLGPDIDDELKDEIHSQSEFIEKEITELKDLLNQMETKYRDPESKNKVKQLKLEAQKQIQRNKIILKDIITTSYLRRSQGKEGEENEQFMEGGVVNYEHLNGSSNGKTSKKEKQSMLTDQLQQRQLDIQIDYEIERKMLLQKNQMINDVQQSTMRINEIINDLGVEVNEQGQNLDVISQELMKTNKNVNEANEQLEEASTLQKKAKRKYICLVVLILIIIVAAGGIIFFLVK